MSEPTPVTAAQPPQAHERPILGYLHADVSKNVEDLIFERPELFELDERELMKKFRSDLGMLPSATDNWLRLRFWLKFDEAVAKGHARLDLAAVIAGVCSRQYFHGKYLKNAYKTAWLLCPPLSYTSKTEEALEFGLSQLRDILELPHIQNGKLDARLGALKVKIVELLDVRVKGAPVQRNLNVNVGSAHAQITAETADLTMEQLKAQMSELRVRERASRNLPMDKPEAKDVISE